MDLENAFRGDSVGLQSFGVVASVVESERFPPTLVAPPLSLSLDPRTPLSALQLPRSPACPPEEPAPAALPTLPTVTPSSVLPNGG